MASFAGKVIAVTGAAQGIGKATAIILHSRGASLALADLKADALKEFVSSLECTGEQKVTQHIVDVRDTMQVNGWIEGIMREFGKLDGACNIAGVVTKDVGGIANTSDEDWDFTMGVNATGVFKCLRAELKHMSEGGAIVSTASIAGISALSGGLPAYTASKHAVIGLTKSAAVEGGYRGIRVNAVAPGLIATPMLQGAMKNRPPEDSPSQKRKTDINSVPLSRVAQPEEVGRLIAYLLSSDASYVNGEVVRIDGGWLS